MRTLLLATAVTLALATPLSRADDTKLPDIGSSAGELLTPARQAEYGGMMLRELRNYGFLLDDPLVDDWLNTMGRRLGSNSAQPQQKYTFFMMKDRQINAFATLGGYIGMNAGLVLTAEREDEVAAVLSHEIAHVTQQHVLRGVERAQRDQIPILLG
ncbi:MAG: M48 family metalloprotease, partial [Stenotrophomonas sp.]